MGENGQRGDRVESLDAESTSDVRTFLGVPANKRGALGVLCWLVGAVACFTPLGFAVGIPLLLVAAYLLLY